MIKKTLIIIGIFLSTYSLNAYETPKINLEKDNKPQITAFFAESVIVKNKPSYKVSWKTINATNVQITYIGKVDLSGSITVTDDEYNRGPITLTASSRESSFSNSRTINKHKNSDAPQTKFVAPEEDRSFYSTPALYPRPIRRPLRRRY